MSLSINNKEHLWVEKYRPQKISDLIIPKHLEKTFKSITEAKKAPNLLLNSKIPGLGKTSLSLVLANELETDTLFLNASRDVNIDLLRDKLDKFASSMSLEKGGRLVIFDELDGAMKKNAAVGDSLRGFIEKYSSNCSYIITCNYGETIPEPIKSRCQQIDYQIYDIPDFSKKIWTRCQEILENEKIEYDKKIVLEIIKKFSPDVRTIIQNLQLYRTELTDSTLKYRMTGINVEQLVKLMKEKDFRGIMKFIHNDVEITSSIYRQIFNALESFVSESSLPIAVQILGDFNSKHNLSVDPTIAAAAFIIEFTENINFK